MPRDAPLGENMLVTILMPVYNAAGFVKAATLSILHQSYRNIEFLIIDDGSTDGSADILKELAARDGRVKLIRRENRGLVATLNQGLNEASGDLVARMDADDIAYPERLAAQVLEFERDPRLCLLGMRADYLYSDGYLVRSKARSLTPEEARIESMFHCAFVHPTVMMNNRILQKHGVRYSKTNPLNEDHELWSRLVAKYPGRIMGQSGIAWRQHERSVRSTHFQMQMVASWKLVQRDLRSAGIDVDISALSDVAQFKGRPTDQQARNFREALRAVWDFRSSFSPPEAFERGFASFLTNLFDASIRLGNPRETGKLIYGAGFGHLIQRRQKLLVSISRLAGNSAANASSKALRSVGRRVRCERIDRLKILSPEIVRAL